MGKGREGEEDKLMQTFVKRLDAHHVRTLKRQSWNSTFNYIKGATCKMRPEFKGFPKKMLQHFNRASSQCHSLSLMSSLQLLSMIASVEETPRVTELNWTREQLRDRKYRLKVKYISSQGEHVLGCVNTYTDILKITHSTLQCSISTLEYL